ncbi:YtxH domain-containing protein [Leucobacter iarius]|uniref:YtxH domain-containing protein n=1 Tax=Leucobacter iarius TaxID=333963 RepID=A0ABN2L934_9MICO
MKGKIAFVLGAAVGYVLGTRAGRERYEQIKRGAQTVWNTPPVQRGVEMVRGAVDERAEEAKLFARRVVADVFSSVGRAAAGGAQPRTAPERSAAQADEAAPAETRTTASAPKKTGGSSAKTSASKSSSSKGASSKGSAAKSSAAKSAKRSTSGQGE